MVPQPTLADALRIPRRRNASIRDEREATFVDKYVGCLLGGLVGDCLGAPFDASAAPASLLLHAPSRSRSVSSSSVESDNCVDHVAVVGAATATTTAAAAAVASVATLAGSTGAAAGSVGGNLNEHADSHDHNQHHNHHHHDGSGGGGADDGGGDVSGFDYDVTKFLENIRLNKTVPGQAAGRNHRTVKGSRVGCYCYTDVTATTLCLARSLANKRRFVASDVASRLTDEYFSNEQLALEYGDAVRDVFRKWRRDGLADDGHIYGPAGQQFAGVGSFGNGAAVRAAPVAVLYKDDADAAIETAILQAKLTHAHPTGICAAVLFCEAVRHALLADPAVGINEQLFLEALTGRIDSIEEELDGFRPLTYKLHIARKLLSNADWDDASPLQPPPAAAAAGAVTHAGTTPHTYGLAEAVRLLGNDTTAQGSVPTAIVCFLAGVRRTRSATPAAGDWLSDKWEGNPFVRTLDLALRCGGDTGAIASMACTLTGAYLGSLAIPAILLRHCQGVEIVTKVAETFATKPSFNCDL